jgi:regulator of nucleoside diphosphate kinase
MGTTVLRKIALLAPYEFTGLTSCRSKYQEKQMENRIVVSRHDLLRLRALLGSHARTAAGDRAHLLDLKEEMERATVIDTESLPSNVVAIESTVIVLDVESGAHNHYTLVLPSHADVAQGRISVLAPLGTALLGCRTGEIVEWRMPGGLRRLRIEAVQHPQPTGDKPPAPRRLAA